MSKHHVKELLANAFHYFGWPASGGLLLAVGQAEGIPNWLTGTTTISGTLVLGWFVWHTLTKTIPQMQRTFREEMAEARKAHAEVMKDKDGRHEREMSEMRNIVSSLQGMLIDSFSSDRKAVHDVAGNAQKVLNMVAKSEIERERKG